MQSLGLADAELGFSHLCFLKFSSTSSLSLFISSVLLRYRGYLFRETLDIVNKLVLTRVDCNIDGDVFYPEINLENWRETSYIEHKKDSENEYDFKVIVLEKN